MLSIDMNSQSSVYETLDKIMTMKKRQDDTQYRTMNYQWWWNDDAI
jgi:hypothetical protein